MTRILSSMVLAVIALLAWPGPARAAESYDNCTGFIDSLPAVISRQGTWCLRKDLSTAIASGNAITIATNNVTLDCNDFKIGGLAAGLETGAIGVRAVRRFNTTVRNCRIRGFHTGVALVDEGGGHKVEGNTLEGSRIWGMKVRGAGSMVRGNRVIDSGGSTRDVSPGVGIEVIGGVDVIDNLIRGVRPFPIKDGNGVVIPRLAIGIDAINNDGGNIIGNRVSGVVPVGSRTGTEGYGILNRGQSPTRVIVSGNILKGARSSAFIDNAILCAKTSSSPAADAISVDNVLVGFDAAIVDCSSSWPGGNSVNSN